MKGLKSSVVFEHMSPNGSLGIPLPEERFPLQAKEIGFGPGHIGGKQEGPAPGGGQCARKSPERKTLLRGGFIEVRQG